MRPKCENGPKKVPILRISPKFLILPSDAAEKGRPPPEGMVPNSGPPPKEWFQILAPPRRNGALNSGPPPKEWFQILSLKMTSKKAKFALLGRF